MVNPNPHKVSPSGSIPDPTILSKRDTMLLLNIACWIWISILVGMLVIVFVDMLSMD